MDLVIEPEHPVLVTGATGYVAGHVVRRLLDEGLTVHATVRDASNEGRLAYLHALAEDRPGRLELFSADLLNDGSFAEAMAGCPTVFHIASPFLTASDDPQRDLVDPAVNGTRNVLDEASRTPSVERVVLTSSCAAIYGENADLAKVPGGAFTEATWNETSTLERGAYSYSKTQAEREAWRIAEAQDRWRLVVVNPSMVLGPGVRMHPSSESFKFLTQIVDGTLASGAPDFQLGVVDVRDLADAHLAAAFIPDAEGRHIISGGTGGILEIAEALREPMGARLRLPTRKLPKWLIWLIGPMMSDSLTRPFIAGNFGLPWKGDNTKSREALGMRYRPLQETVVDHVQQLLDEGALPPR